MTLENKNPEELTEQDRKEIAARQEKIIKTLKLVRIFAAKDDKIRLICPCCRAAGNEGLVFAQWKDGGLTARCSWAGCADFEVSAKVVEAIKVQPPPAPPIKEAIQKAIAEKDEKEIVRIVDHLRRSGFILPDVQALFAKHGLPEAELETIMREAKG